MKALFGLISDAFPINGYHRAPYMLLCAGVGMVSTLTVAMLAPEQISHTGALLLLMGAYVGIAGVDVQIDATICERARVRPDLAADMQSLCWGALAVLSVPVTLLMAVLLQFVGAKPLFALVALAMATTCFAPLQGWIGEKRAPQVKGACTRCTRMLHHPHKRPVALAAGLTAAYSCTVGIVQTAFSASSPASVTLFTIGANMGFCLALFLVLRSVDECLARAAVFVLLQNALVPTSSIMFEWSHAPTASKHDSRCFDAAACAALALGYEANTSLADGLDTSPSQPSKDLDALLGSAMLPCGWARARHAPCISPFVLTSVNIIALAGAAFASYLYSRSLQGCSYKSILMGTQLILAAVSLVDLIWVQRLNKLVGISDVAFIFGDEAVRASGLVK